MSNFSLDFDLYEHFSYGKQIWVRFSFVSMRLEGVLQPMHNDVFGPMLIPSLVNFVYYVSFIDDLSRNMRIYFLKNKF